MLKPHEITPAVLFYRIKTCWYPINMRFWLRFVFLTIIVISPAAAADHVPRVVLPFAFQFVVYATHDCEYVGKNFCLVELYLM